MYVPVYGPNTRRPPSQTLTASGRMSSRVALESTRSCASFTTSCIVRSDRHQVDRVLACPLRCIKGEILCLTCSSIAKLIQGVYETNKSLSVLSKHRCIRQTSDICSLLIKPAFFFLHCTQLVHFSSVCRDKMESLLHVLFIRYQALQFQELVSQGGGG